MSRWPTVPDEQVLKVPIGTDGDWLYQFKSPQACARGKCSSRTIKSAASS